MTDYYRGGNIGAAYVHGKTNYCHWCERALLSRKGRHIAPLPALFPTRDHIHPKSKGGHSWVWACYDCNMRKRDMTEAEWRAFMKANPSWWGHGVKAERRPVPRKSTSLFTVEAIAKAEYPNDPKAQAAFIGVYKKVPHMLARPLDETDPEVPA